MTAIESQYQTSMDSSETTCVDMSTFVEQPVSFDQTAEEEEPIMPLPEVFDWNTSLISRVRTFDDLLISIVFTHCFL
jgi:hypothetical protein